MIILDTLTIKQYNPEGLDIFWTFEPTQESLSNYVINIYRSQAPSLDNTLGEYEKVAENIPADTFSYLDASVKGLVHGTRTWYYRLEVIDTVTPETTIQPFEGYAYLHDEVPNTRWLKIYRHKKLSLDRKTGRDFLLLKKRSWGERCEVSWDSILYKTNDKVCDTCDCWGTGWRRGFFTPQKFKGMLNPAPQAKQLSIWGEFYPSDSLLYLLNKPPLEVGDVIVDLQKNHRFSVQRVRTIELLGAPIEQQAQLSLIHVDDEIYNYDIQNYA